MCIGGASGCEDSGDMLAGGDCGVVCWWIRVLKKSNVI